MVILKGRIKPDGNSYCIRIKKALVEAEVLKLGREYAFELIREEEIKRLLPNFDWQSDENQRLSIFI